MSGWIGLSARWSLSIIQPHACIRNMPARRGAFARCHSVRSIRTVTLRPISPPEFFHSLGSVGGVSSTMRMTESWSPWVTQSVMVSLGNAESGVDALDFLVAAAGGRRHDQHRERAREASPVLRAHRGTVTWVQQRS